MVVGDEVSIVLDEDSQAIGWITSIEDDKVTVREAHAFHQLWGGSSAGRGTVHTVPESEVKECYPPYKHIVREQKAKFEAQS